MPIVIEHHNDQFNVGMTQGEGKEPYLVIKGCRVREGNKGRFISWPASKTERGWWNHVYATEAFQTAVLNAYDASKPKAAPKRAPAPADDEIPF